MSLLFGVWVVWNIRLKDGLDDRLARWGGLFEELALDAETIVRDLSELINYVASTAMLMTVLGVAALISPVLRGMDARYVGATRTLSTVGGVCFNPGMIAWSLCVAS